MTLSKSSRKKITILHTNDTHSRIDPFPENDAKYAGLGGISKRASLIEKIRSEEQHVLLLDAGDIFQGTPYFNLYGGEVEFRMMSALKYDAATMGNHDFDVGLDGFLKALPHATFPFLCANYDFSDTVLKDQTSERKIFLKDNLKIGVFGIGVELKGLVPDKLFGNTKYHDPIAAAQKQADILKHDEKCDLVICLSHLGHKPKLNSMCDPVLAANTDNINLIIGGHSHTFMEKPEEHTNKSGKKVLINQVGWAGLVLGRIDFYFDNNGEPSDFASYGFGLNEVIG
ncbi:MAG: metallophosphatase, partial [Crocinitomicaceae bacterium]|nr:metallophosphatase [Crocinitomicaceae bacterium]